MDASLLTTARHARSGLSDAAILDEALAALLARDRVVEIEAAYRGYDRLPLDTRDDWGNLAAFRAAADAS